jgi:hypothetical protein
MATNNQAVPKRVYDDLTLPSLIDNTKEENRQTELEYDGG